MTLNCKGTLVSLEIPKIMGILNLTPDSFYDGGRYEDIDTAVTQTKQMLAEGATFIDVGAYSSRPGASAVSEEEEELRLIPVITELVTNFPDILISVDTFRASVARKAIEAGAAMINDISAGMMDTEMMATVGTLGVPYAMMHMRGTPATMQSLTDYDNLVKEVIFYFSERLAAARAAHINDVIIDPGFGFAKTTEQNFELLSKLELLQQLDVPILAGLSRKSMIYKTLETTATEALNGTTALHSIALTKGANILRVHDVKPAMECVTLWSALS